MRMMPVLAMLLAAGCGTSSSSSDVLRASEAPTTAASPVSAPRSAPSTAQAPRPSGSAAATAAPAGTASAAPATVVAVTGTPAPRRPSATPSAIASPAGTVVVDDAANGSTLRVRVGQRVEVRLSKDTYDPPVSSAPAVVVRRSNRGGYPSSDPVDAVFEAVGKGAADLSTQSDYACFHTQPQCYPPTRQWAVHVIVT